jgi:transposase
VRTVKVLPKQHSSGGRDKLGNISKRGDRYLRSLFTAGTLLVDPNFPSAESQSREMQEARALGEMLVDRQAPLAGVPALRHTISGSANKF